MSSWTPGSSGACPRQGLRVSERGLCLTGGAFEDGLEQPHAGWLPGA